MKKPSRFQVALRMLRIKQLGAIEQTLPDLKRGESAVDWMVRHKMAPTPQVAAEILIAGSALSETLNEIMREIEAQEVGADP